MLHGVQHVKIVTTSLLMILTIAISIAYSSSPLYLVTVKVRGLYPSGS